jgi:two-component system, chemotaxis family, chemotaxis protein CheY
MPLNILIVDDSPVMRTFVRRVMQLTGLDVEKYLEAGNGAEALDLAATTPLLDAVFTDINMPVMDGEEFVRQFRKQPSRLHTPVIVISTDATAHRIENMLGLGASGYIQKPFGPEQLRNEVERVLLLPRDFDEARGKDGKYV